MGYDAPPWKDQEYKIQAIIDELDIDIREKFLKEYFYQADVSVDGKDVTLDYEPFMRKEVIAGGEDWYSVQSVEAFDINTVRVTLSVER